MLSTHLALVAGPALYKGQAVALPPDIVALGLGRPFRVTVAFWEKNYHHQLNLHINRT